VRTYQAQHLASPAGETCLLELLPLPSPSTDRWIYADQSGLPMLESRATYVEMLVPQRIALLRGLIREHRPRYVIFVGLSYIDHWNQIVGTGLAIGPEQPATLDNLGATVVAIRHPSSFGASNDYFAGIGRALRATTS
jgi:hypothetical protein